MVTARPVSTTGYDTFGDDGETQDPNGNVTTYGYDADGQQVSRDPAAVHPAGRVLADHRGRHHRLRRRRAGHLGHRRAEQHHAVRLRPARRPGHRDRPGHSVTTTAYDADGRAAVDDQPHRRGDRHHLRLPGPGGDLHPGRAVLPGRARPAYTTTYAYDDSGGARAAAAGCRRRPPADSVTTSYTYDAAGEVTSVTDGASDTTSYAYDALGRKTKVTYPDGTATATYDPAGNVTSTSSLDATGTTLATTSADLRRRRRPAVGHRRRGQHHHVHLRPDRAGDRGDPAGVGHLGGQHVVRLRPGREPDAVHRRQREPVVGHLQQLGPAGVPGRAVHQRRTPRRRTPRSPSPTTPTAAR